MPTEAPIACSLSAAQMHERAAKMATVGQSSLLAVETNDSRAVLRFRAGAPVLGELVAAFSDRQRQCRDC
jgi:hypothetical protein